MTWLPRKPISKRSDPDVMARIIAPHRDGLLIEAQWPDTNKKPQTNILVVSRRYWRQRYGEMK